MRKILLAGFFISFYSLVFSQSAPNIQWQKVFGGTITDYRTNAVDSTLDGGYVIAGSYGYGYNINAPSSVSPYTDAFLAKFDASGAMVWKKTYDAYRNDSLSLQISFNTLNTVKHTSDGGYIAAGYCTSILGTPAAFVMKTNANGDTLWERELQIYSGGSFNSVKQTADGGYIVAGYKNLFGNAVAEDYYVVKLDAQGNTVWEKSYGGTNSDVAYSVAQTTDGGYILTGFTYSGFYTATDGDVSGNHSFGQASSSSDIWLVKLDANGNLSWQKCLGSTGYDFANCVNTTSDGGYIIGGYSNGNNGDVTSNKGTYDYWIVKTTNTGTVTWQKSYGGTQNDNAYDIKPTSDGGYVVTGYSSSNDGDVTGHHTGTSVRADAWTLKLTNTGNISWQNSAGSVNSEGGKSIVNTSSGIVVAGTNNSKNYTSLGYSSGDYWLFKLNASGGLLWQDVAGASGGYNVGRSLVQATDGGFITAGYGNSNNTNINGAHGGFDGLILKTDNSGALQWSKAIGGLFDDYISSMTKTNDGGFIAAGTSNSSDGDVTMNKGNSDYWVVKLTSAGAISWQKTYGGSGFDSATSIIQTSDGGYIVAGRSTSNNNDVSGNHGDYDYWIVKLDAQGNITWQKSYGGTGADYPYAIKQTTDGGYIVGGRSNSADGNVSGNHGGFDYWIIKIDATGNLTWQKSFGGSSDDFCYSIYVTNDNNILATGSTSSTNGDVTGLHGAYGFPDFWLLKLKSDGTLLWEKTYGSSDYETALSVIESTDGSYVVSGSSGTDYYLANNSDVTGNHGLGDVWVIKTDTLGNLQWEQSYGGTNSESGVALTQATDGSYVITGLTSSNNGDVSGNPSTSGSNNVWVFKLQSDALPVTLLSFSGAVKDDNALLQWRTGTETNNKGFTIQRSFDGKNFADIGFVSGSGTSGGYSYAFTDAHMSSGYHYYRLQQTDFDGKIVYSAIIKLDYAKFAWEIVGNPVVSQSAITLQLPKKAAVSVHVYNAGGSLISVLTKGVLEHGTYIIPLGLDHLSSGVYTVQLVCGDQSFSKKVVR